MPESPWQTLPQLGIELLDTQHAELFQLVDQLSRALKGRPKPGALTETLALLSQRTIKHFQTEEGLMKEAGYPGLADHAAEHNRLILQVRALQYAYGKGESITRATPGFLADWFDHHIKEADMGYVPFVGGR
jgi:hemerythrin